MLVEGFKQGLGYTASIGERTFGVDAYRRVLKNFGERTPTVIGAATFGLAFRDLFPAATSSAMRVQIKDRNEYSPNILICIELLLDVGIAMWATSQGQNIAEGLAVKFAANAATHVGLDIIEAGINRARRFRHPSPATLAV